MDATLWSCECVRVRVRALSPSCDVVEVDVSETPAGSVDALCATVRAGIVARERRIVLCIRPRAATIPACSQLLSVAAHLLEARHDVEALLRGTVIVGLDASLHTARDLFLGLYRPLRPLEFVDDARAVEEMLHRIGDV